MQIDTPAFIIDLEALERNAVTLGEVKRRAGCKILLALKAFSLPAALSPFKGRLDGVCASSVHEARLGVEAFGSEVHAFAAAFTETQMRELVDLGVDHFTFNSFRQLDLFRRVCSRPATIGLRVNPEHSEGQTPIYDPCARFSRLGIVRTAFNDRDLEEVTGLHFHNLCEQNADCFVRTLAAFENRFATIIPHMKWFNFGGGHHITRPDYDIDLLVETICSFRRRHGNPTVYLEPGEACVLNAGTLAATVVDVVENGMPIAILDASCACHTPDVMEMPYRPRIFRQSDWQGNAQKGARAACAGEPNQNPYTYRLAGPSCLAGDVFGDYSFETPLSPGDRLYFEDMAHYTLVKTNTFNGINLPSIYLRHADGGLELVRQFGYSDFIGRLA